MCIWAPAAIAKITTEWNLALWRWFKHAAEPCPREPFLDLDDLNFDDFTYDNEGNENNKILNPRHPLPAEGDVANRRSQQIAYAQTHRGRLILRRTLCRLLITAYWSLITLAAAFTSP